ncbi:alpha/beta hydrolase [Pseudorhodoferax sp.]|uniref:alpha/beta hydrolase n=1 Tax=Pseudorhodoferax sp. TaxID=1993553 RepID=UPI002DD62B6D|nr:lysophospholipase [Pseudorhodoferax sp.]
MLIVHGLGEHGGRYAAVAQALNQAGWDVTAHDQRGHGRSPGARGDLPAPDALCADLAAVFDRLQQEDDGQAPLLLGHSMGGLVAARFVAEALAPRPAAWSRAVPALLLSSPALDPGMNGVQKLLLALMARVAPGMAVGNGLRPAWLSHDEAVVRAYRQDALVHDRITARLARFIVDGGAHVRRQAARWRVPTLLLWAGADRCVAPAGSAAFAAAAPAAVLQHRVWPALYHEIFNEPERAQVLAELTGWLARHTAAART